MIPLSTLLILIGLPLSFSLALKLRGIAFQDAWRDLLNTFYQPHYNECLPPLVDNWTILPFLYQFTLILFLIVFFIWRISKRARILIPSPSSFLIIASLIILTVFTFLQQYSRGLHFAQNTAIFEHKTVSEKNKILFGDVYSFAERCNQTLAGRHFCRIETDLNPSRDPYSTVNRLLSYYLYPKAALRFNPGSPQNCLLAISKKNFLDTLPTNYTPVVIQENHKLILAIKKEDIFGSN